MSEKAQGALVTIRRVEATDALNWLEMRAMLWPETPRAEHRLEIEAILKAVDLDAFLAIDGKGSLVGFVELSLRPHVNGCLSRPVAFIEGIWVREDQRTCGIGRRLIACSNEWARERGVRELASDVDQVNHNSIAAHLAWGFEETERVVYFRLPVDGTAVS